MTRSLLFTIMISLSLGAAAHAQQTKRDNKAPAPAEVAPAVPPPSLSEEDRRILERGEIGTGRYIIGGVFGTYPGFGLGHLIQGRWLQRGWIFTAGEAGSALLMMTGMADCLSSSDWDEDDDDYDDRECNRGSGAVILGMVGFIGFKVWEVIDVWLTPPMQNRRYRRLRDQQKVAGHWSGFLAPVRDGGKLVLQYSF